LVRVTLDVETIGVGEVSRVTVDTADRDDRKLAAREFRSSYFKFFRRAARREVDGGVITKELFDGVLG
jgi:hypothetical protein